MALPLATVHYTLTPAPSPVVPIMSSYHHDSGNSNIGPRTTTTATFLEEYVEQDNDEGSILSSFAYPTLTALPCLPPSLPLEHADSATLQQQGHQHQSSPSSASPPPASSSKVLPSSQTDSLLSLVNVSAEATLLDQQWPNARVQQKSMSSTSPLIHEQGSPTTLPSRRATFSSSSLSSLSSKAPAPSLRQKQQYIEDSLAQIYFHSGSTNNNNSDPLISGRHSVHNLLHPSHHHVSNDNSNGSSIHNDNKASMVTKTASIGTKNTKSIQRRGSVTSLWSTYLASPASSSSSSLMSSAGYVTPTYTLQPKPTDSEMDSNDTSSSSTLGRMSWIQRRKSAPMVNSGRQCSTVATATQNKDTATNVNDTLSAERQQQELQKQPQHLQTSKDGRPSLWRRTVERFGTYSERLIRRNSLPFAPTKPSPLRPLSSSLLPPSSINSKSTITHEGSLARPLTVLFDPEAAKVSAPLRSSSKPLSRMGSGASLLGLSRRKSTAVDIVMAAPSTSAGPKLDPVSVAVQSGTD